MSIVGGSVQTYELHDFCPLLGVVSKHTNWMTCVRLDRRKSLGYFCWPLHLRSLKVSWLFLLAVTFKIVENLWVIFVGRYI